MLYEFDCKVPEIDQDAYVSEHAVVIGNVLIEKECYIRHGVILREIMVALK